MREIIRDRVVRCDAERAVILTQAYKKYENVAPIIKKPLALYDICAKGTIFIEDFELIVGGKGPNYFSSPGYPEWGVSDWILEPLSKGEWELRDDGLYHNPDTDPVRQSISPEDYAALAELQPYWDDGHKIGAGADAWKPDGFEELARLNVSSYVEGGMGLISLPAGHLIAGYKKIINSGYGAIRAQAQQWIDDHYGDLMGEDIDKYMFYKSAVIACDGAIVLAKRYAALAKEKAAAEKDPARKTELTWMAESMEWISEKPARTFWEALQLTMFYQVFLHLDLNMPSPALGRIDQYTWPFLKRDLDEGRITMDAAQEMIDAFFLKANCYYGAGPAKLVDTTGVGNTYQHTTIGGVDPDTGEDATNPVTFMVLETVGRLKLHDPTISLRINKNTPDELWGCALETSKLVGGLPLFQNDEVIIPSLMEELNFELRDARDFGIIGCQEIVGCGNDFPAPNGLFPPHASVLWASIFNMAINNGINPFNGEQSRLKTGYLYEMNSIEEVRAAVKSMGSHIMKLFLSINNYADYMSKTVIQEASLSISMDGCMEKGMDAAVGGCKYNSWGGTATGLATLADSLATIKYMCFDKKKCTTRELHAVVLANWEGYEPLRQQILNEVPHYGNADPYADEELKWCADMYYEICQSCTNTRGGKYKAGLYGASDHVKQGYNTWATPDGRLTGTPIADAMSPSQSRDTNGPTAVFASSCCFDHHHYLGGIALNLRMHPTVLSRDDGIEKLRDMTKAYFENGGMEVQYNVVDTDTLRKAQKEPTEYRDLVVRIAGYSAYFVELGHDLQNDIIARNENRI
jgi:formate C-acetyltransferase